MVNSEGPAPEATIPGRKLPVKIDPVG